MFWFRNSRGAIICIIAKIFCRLSFNGSDRIQILAKDLRHSFRNNDRHFVILINGRMNNNKKLRFLVRQRMNSKMFIIRTIKIPSNSYDEKSICSNRIVLLLQRPVGTTINLKRNFILYEESS